MKDFIEKHISGHDKFDCVEIHLRDDKDGYIRVLRDKSIEIDIEVTGCVDITFDELFDGLLEAKDFLKLSDPDWK